jgi:hypothetical protein
MYMLEQHQDAVSKYKKLVYPLIQIQGQLPLGNMLGNQAERWHQQC